GHRIRTAAVAITASLLFLFPSAVLAQGLPMFPDPINTKTLIQYADRLELSVDQRLALEPLHDAYLDRFRRLRDKDMQAFQDHLLDIAINFMRSRFAIPERVELEQLIQEFQHVQSKIAAVDRSLFNEIESILDDQQHLKLQRVRKQRRIQALRTVILNIGGNFNPGARADLVDLVEGLELSADEVALVEPILVGYESALLSRAKVLHGVLRAATTDMLDTIDELGLRDMTPEQMMQLGENQELLEALRTKFDEASVPFQKAVHDISKLNLKTARRMMKLLSDDNTFELRDRYYKSAYRAAYSSPGAYRRRYIEAAKLESIAAELAEQIRIERDEFMRQDDQLIDDLVDVLEKSRQYRTMAILSDEAPDPLEEKASNLNDRRAALLERADATLQALIGPELFAQFADESAPGAKGAPAEQPVLVQELDRPPRVTRDGELASDVASHANQRVKDPRLPNPISAGDFQRFVRRSNIGEGSTAVVDLLYQDYREKFDEILYAPLTTEDQTEADEPEPDEDGLLQQRLVALQEADDRFFDDVAIMAADDRQSKLVQRLRLLRRRAVHHEVTRAYPPFQNDSRGGLDLVRLVYDAELDESALVALEPILDSYESEAAPVFQERLELAKAVDRIRQAAERATESQASSGVIAALKDKQRQQTQRFFANRRRLTSINEDHLDRILTQLPTQSAVPLRFTYYQQAYPQIFRDSREIEESIASILRFPNLADAQRNQIVAISQNFRSRFMEISDKGIALQREQEDESSRSSFGMPSRAMLERELQRERLEFDRDEVCARAMMHLHLALSETQREYLPQLDN
ncbi:MAG: hypothetical protein IIA64_08940, partial [Planctomycetes bacterium]|nr:hypothetical protein [Planctomycetota bacterium]